MDLEVYILGYLALLHVNCPHQYLGIPLSCLVDLVQCFKRD